MASPNTSPFLSTAFAVADADVLLLLVVVVEMEGAQEETVGSRWQWGECKVSVELVHEET